MHVQTFKHKNEYNIYPFSFYTNEFILYMLFCNSFFKPNCQFRRYLLLSTLFFLTTVQNSFVSVYQNLTNLLLVHI